MPRHARRATVLKGAGRRSCDRMVNPFVGPRAFPRSPWGSTKIEQRIGVAKAGSAVRQAPLESPGTQDAPAGRVAPRPSPPPPPLPGAKPRQHGAWLVTLPWLIAAVGWLVAALFLVYSHGQSDRLRITRQD